MFNSSPTIQNIRYANPLRPGFDIEVMHLSDLLHRATTEHFQAPQRPQFHLLLFITRGNGRHLIDFRAHSCRCGTVLHVRPGQVQQYVTVPGFEALVVLFSPSFVPSDHELTRLSGHHNLVDHVLPDGSLLTAGPTAVLIGREFEQLCSEYGQLKASPLTISLIRHLLQVLLLRLALLSIPKNSAALPHTAASRTVARFQRELERRFTQSHKVGDFASWLNCSSRTLHSSCMTMRGVGPKSLIEHRVILEAQRLLVHTALPVEGISVDLGFDEPANFTRMFRRIAGASPRSFRDDRRRALDVQ